MDILSKTLSEVEGTAHNIMCILPEPLRADNALLDMEPKHIKALRAINGEFLTNYPTYHLMVDGGVLCQDCLEETANLVMMATRDPNTDHQWQYETTLVNHGETELFCDHCYCRIHPALRRGVNMKLDLGIWDRDGATIIEDAVESFNRRYDTRFDVTIHVEDPGYRVGLSTTFNFTIVELQHMLITLLVSRIRGEAS